MSSTPWYSFTDPDHIVNDRLLMTVAGICLTVGILVVTELSQLMKRSATKRNSRAWRKPIDKAVKNSINAIAASETEMPCMNEKEFTSEQAELPGEQSATTLTKSQKRNRKRREKRKEERVAAKLEHDEEIRRRLAAGKELTE